ncbi:MAG TPA: response regulator [Casimicrobiaceae bacterium]|nr:response regulator [Casimicrobiaceae bacterium]
MNTASRNAAPLRNLLLIDDDQVLCQVMARAFEARGYNVRTAHTGRDGIAAAQAFRPDAAVVDLRLPDQTGLKLIGSLKAINGDMRIVVLTGHGSIPTAIEAVKLGATYYLTKPVEADEVVAALAKDAANDGVPVDAKPMSVDRLEWEHIQRVLRDNNDNVSATARALSMHRRTLQRKLRKHPARV